MNSSEQWCGIVGATANRTWSRSSFHPENAVRMLWTLVVHDGGVRRRREPGRADRGDGVAGDQDVGGVSAVGPSVEEKAAADDRRQPRRRTAQRRALASRIARQTRSEVTGMSR